jgi:hypothetical protein
VIFAYLEFIFLKVLVFLSSCVNFVEACVTFGSTVFKDYLFSPTKEVVCFRKEMHRFEYLLWKWKHFCKCCSYYSGTTVEKKSLYYESEARNLLQLAMRGLENFPFNWFSQLPLNLHIRFRYKSLQSATHKYVRSVYYELAQLVVHADPYKLVHPIFYKFMHSATCKTMQYYAYKLMSINLYSNYSPADKT